MPISEKKLVRTVQSSFKSSFKPSQWLYFTESEQTEVHKVIFQGGFVLGEPHRTECLGETQLPYSVFLDFVLSLGDTKYK